MMKKILLILTVLFGLWIPANAAFLTGNVVSEPGEGVTTSYMRTSFSYINIQGLFVMEQYDSGGAVQFVTASDGTVWVNYPISGFPVNNWMVGQMQGDEIIFNLPQAIYVDEGNTFFLAMMQYDNGVYSMTESQTFKLIKDGENWITEETDQEIMLSMVAADGSFAGMGDYDYTYTPFTSEYVEAPQGLETETYSYFSSRGGILLNIGFDGDDVYVQGLLQTDPDSWIKGTRNGDTVKFPSYQYIGIWDFTGFTPHHCYFMAGSKQGDYYVKEDELVFTYNANDKTFTSTGDLVYSFTDNPDNVFYVDVVENPKFTYQDISAVLTPSNPHDITLNNNNVTVIIPQTSTDGLMMDADNLYYRMYVDDELFTFRNDEYIYLDAPAMTELPYTYSEGYDIIVMSEYHDIYIYFTDCDKIGFQSVYFQGNKVNVSDIVYSDGSVVSAATSVCGPEADVNVVATEYFDTTGRLVPSTAKGLLIKRVSKADGTISSEKVIRR